MDRLRLMKTLITVVQKRSFAAAAKELGVSRGLLSKHIKQLEDGLGVQLLQRDTHSMNLTERGVEYYEFCLQILDDMERAEAAIAGHDRQPQGSLKILAPISFGTLYMGPFVHMFMQKYPSISVSVNLWGQSIQSSALIEHSFDLVVRTSPSPDSSLVTRAVAPIRNVVCASSDYLKSCGRPRVPADLMHHKCLYHRAEASNRWCFKDQAGKNHFVKLPASLVSQSNSLHLLKHLAVCGMGVGILPDYCLAEELRSGSLKEIMPNYSAGGGTLYVIFPPSRFLPLRLRLFIDEFAQYFGEKPWLVKQAA